MEKRSFGRKCGDNIARQTLHFFVPSSVAITVDLIDSMQALEHQDPRGHGLMAHSGGAGHRGAHVFICLKGRRVGI